MQWKERFWVFGMEGVVEGVGRTQAKPYLGFDTSSPNLFHIISILYFLNYYY